VNFLNMYSFKKADVDGIITVSFIVIYDLENLKFWKDQSTAPDL